jgi:transaldolase
MAQALQELAAAGVAVWLDDLSRPRIQSGSLARLVGRGDIVGITTNFTIFAKAIGAAPVMRSNCVTLRCAEPPSARRFGS